MYRHGLENKKFVQLPEGVDIAITPAGLVSRSIAYLIDFAIRAVIMAVAGIGLGVMGNAGQGLWLIGYFVISWGYNIVFEARNGQTPGKKRLAIRVVQENGLPASFSQIVLRNLLRPADMLPFGYFLGLIVMACNGRFKRIGDWAAGTMVVYQDDTLKLRHIGKGEVTVPSVQLSTEEQLAILTFAERRKQLSPARCQELATILAENLKLESHDPEASLLSLARFYAGHHSHSVKE